MAVPFTDDHGSVRLCMLLSLLVLRVSVAVAAAPAPTPAAYGSEIVEALAAAKGLGSVMVPRQASNLQVGRGVNGKARKKEREMEGDGEKMKRGKNVMELGWILNEGCVDSELMRGIRHLRVLLVE